jgi:hypothetical protein
MRLYFGAAFGKVVPPSFRVFVGHVKRQLLAMDADGLIAKLLRVLLNELHAPSVFNLCPRKGRRLLLLHPEMAHFTPVQSLFGILVLFKVTF